MHGLIKHINTVKPKVDSDLVMLIMTENSETILKNLKMTSTMSRNAFHAADFWVGRLASLLPSLLRASASMR